jgi:hypothetical protein
MCMIWCNGVDYVRATFSEVDEVRRVDFHLSRSEVKCGIREFCRRVCYRIETKVMKNSKNSSKARQKDVGRETCESLTVCEVGVLRDYGLGR